MKLINILTSTPFSALGTDKELCIDVQRILAALGLLEDSDVTGIYNDKTTNALVQFKRNKNLTGGNFIGKTTALAFSNAKATLIITRSQAEYVYETKLTDSQFADLNACCRTFCITSKEDIRQFLAQTAHESGGLKYMKEIGTSKYFTDNYEWRDDLGNNQAGDGAKYPGISPLQITGRANYQAFANYIGDQRVMEGVDYVGKHYGFQPSGFWWIQNRVSEKITKGATITQISALVNTGSINTSPNIINGLEERIYYYKRAQEVI